jgi:MoaA/NifB/PqqE/SkfB family radical SAM enzyme
MTRRLVQAAAEETWSENVEPSVTPYRPSTLFVEITTQCNSRCRYCHMWTTREGNTALATAEKLQVIDDFHRMNPQGAVFLSGGETMSKASEFFTLSAHCRRLRMLCAANTNGSHITDSNLDMVLRQGPKHLVISLDSHRPEIHDYGRGVRGSHARVVKTIAALVRRRAELGLQGHTLLFTNSVLYDRNVAGLPEFAEFATALGLDGIFFQALTPTFCGKGRDDKFYAKHFFPDRAGAIGQIEMLIAALGRFPVIKTSVQDLRWMQKYIANPDFLDEAVCASHERNIMVDSCGDVQLCFNMRKLLGGRVLGNVRTQSLSQLWQSHAAAEARAVMASCRLICGMLNCHRR